MTRTLYGTCLTPDFYITADTGTYRQTVGVISNIHQFLEIKKVKFTLQQAVKALRGIEV
jgi:hypothetical protein